MDIMSRYTALHVILIPDGLTNMDKSYKFDGSGLVIWSCSIIVALADHPQMQFAVD